jgi:hypothetical protein
LSELNPYSPPIVESANFATRKPKVGPPVKGFVVFWLIVFASNLVVPLIFASSLIQQSGRIGMMVAVVLFLIAGWYFGVRFPKIRSRMLAGGSIVAVSQLFPVHHIIAGFIAFEVTRLAGGAIAPTDDEPFGKIATEFGGFLCTSVTGAILLTIAMAIGWLLVSIGIAVRGRFSDTATQYTM